MSESSQALATVDERGADRVMRLFAEVRPEDIDDIGVMIAECEASLAAYVRQAQAHIDHLKRVQATCNVITGKASLPAEKVRRKYTRRSLPESSAAPAASDVPATRSEEEVEDNVRVPRQPPMPNMVGSGADTMKLHNYKDTRDPPVASPASPVSPMVDPQKLMDNRKRAARWLLSKSGPQSPRNIILNAGIYAKFINQVLDYPWFQQVAGGIVLTDQARREVTAA